MSCDCDSIFFALLVLQSAEFFVKFIFFTGGVISCFHWSILGIVNFWRFCIFTDFIIRNEEACI